MNGGGVARRLEEAGAGFTAADPEALGAAIAALVGDPVRRETASGRAKEVAAAFAWDRVVAPLAAFFDEPWISARLPFPETKARTFRLPRLGRR
jgi:glycosyltransferase involved in cell wall biosynthesis